MIKLLKSNNPVNLLIMLALMIILWAFKFFYMPTPIESYETPSYFFPTVIESTKWKYLSAIAAFIIYYIFSLLIIKTNADLVIVESAYQSPGIFFILLTGIYINIQRVIPETLAGMLIFIAIIRIFYSYKKFNALGNCFDAGLLFGIAVLLVSKYILFFLILIIALVTIRPFKFREIISMIFGSLCVFIIVISFIFLYGDFDKFIFITTSSFTKTFTRVNNINNLYIFLPVIVISTIAIASKFVLNISQNIFTRKAQNVLISFLLFSLIYFTSPLSNNESVGIIYAPLSLLLSNLFIKTNKPANYSLLMGIIACIIFLQIFQYKIFY